MTAWNLLFLKGRKELIKAHAEAQGQSVNAYISEAIDEKMSREAVESCTGTIEAGVVSLTLKQENALLRLLRGV